MYICICMSICVCVCAYMNMIYLFYGSAKFLVLKCIARQKRSSFYKNFDEVIKGLLPDSHSSCL